MHPMRRGRTFSSVIGRFPWSAVGAGFLLAALAACSSTPRELDWGRIDEARIEGLEDEPFVLEDGQWEGEPWVEGGAARPRAGLIPEFALEGSFTGDDRAQVAVLLWHSSGGSGTRLWLAVLEPGPDRPHTVATRLVGDRVQVIDFRAAGRELVLELVAHGPEDAACCPGQHELRSYRFDGQAVTEDVQDLGRVTLELLEGRTWMLERFAEGSPAPEGIRITIEFDGPGRASGSAGCNDYEAEVQELGHKDIDFEIRRTTMRRCPESMVAAEGEFLRRLSEATRYSFFRGRLALQYVVDGEFGLMTFVPTATPPSP
jgi:heat shock protein HslJ